ncbi:SusD/RagB family nutrient-binding outer membrane lipoprotein [Paraflavitalea soli]|uniref:SusD/RagB family nutrient-binding outer membrane lipoprotein n=1 Tax=Paraflavitalea soli TaxID=2315862 RepID=A0A3B7N1B7_9BACT|nr:SusD/RagB family nutrient-binding outer membrane lipoprotein [Paraflavitalea soli]AXY77845.1 SusD/RagB family nutrient-binding outer membrane lipoprotein [Paraflavitalea soli]
MNIKKYIPVLLLPLVVMTSCNKLKDFGDTNVNPGTTGTPIPSALLTSITAGFGGYAAQGRGGLYCQYFSETQYTDASLYSVPKADFRDEYAGVLYDCEYLTKLKDATNNQKQLARIIKAYIFWTITDRWGDVPYTEALKGNPNPKYDPQKTIYEGVIKELTEAAAAMDNSFLGGDVVANGNVAKWKKFANSVRILMALRLSKRFPGAGDYAATQLKAALTAPGGIITTNEDNLKVTYPGDAFKCPYFSVYDGRKDVAESKTMTDMMSALGDGRQVAFGGKSELPASPDYNVSSNIGVPYGLERTKAEAFTAANPGWARILRGSYRLQTGSVIILSASNVLLARAEAADRGWTTENAQTLFQDGIKASFAQWELAAPAAGYFTQTNVAFTAPTGTGANLKQIATQRWIATYPDGLQGWSEWRRTGFPVLVPAPDATNSSKQIVRRMTFGDHEYGTNNAVVKAVAAAMPGGDTQDSKVWWDQ